MKKKIYSKPETGVLQMDMPAILAGSLIKKAADSDYKDQNIQDSWNNPEDREIFAD